MLVGRVGELASALKPLQITSCETDSAGCVDASQAVIAWSTEWLQDGVRSGAKLPHGLIDALVLDLSRGAMHGRNLARRTVASEAMTKITAICENSEERTPKTCPIGGR